MPPNPRTGKKTCCSTVIFGHAGVGRGWEFLCPWFMRGDSWFSPPSPVPAMFQLDYLNTCAADDFVAALGEIFEHSPWVAEAAAARRPLPTVAALHNAMVDAVRGAPAD